MEPLQTNQVVPISATVQVTLVHPAYPLSRVYWVLNCEESQSTHNQLKTPKPCGWGNPGGGIEAADMIDSEGNPHYLTDIVQKCGRRETIDETGFLNFEFVSNRHLPLTSDSKHSIYVCTARLLGFQRVDPVKEVETGEIAGGAWFDFSFSPIQQFQNKPDLPYWSHVRRTIACLESLAYISGTYADIHPLWKLVLPVGSKDRRFPIGGYCIPYHQWYQEFRYHLNRSTDDIDLDGIYYRYRNEIDKLRGIPRIAKLPTRITDEDYLHRITQEQIQTEEDAWREFGESLVRPT